MMVLNLILLYLLFHKNLQDFFVQSIRSDLIVEDLQAIKPKLSLRRGECRWSLEFSSIKNEPLLYCDRFLTGGSFFGNFLGWYLETVACANAIGAHYINIGKVYPHPFVKKFPYEVLQLNPATNYTVESLNRTVTQKCPFRHFPWETKGAWSNQTSHLAEIIRTSIKEAYPTVTNKRLKAADFDKLVQSNNFSSVQPNDRLPFIPSAVILFRCVDIIQLLDRRHLYGFIPFPVYSQLLQNQTLRYIYILTEPPKYRMKAYPTHHDKAEKYCSEIITHLMNDLQVIQPNAIIGVRRGKPFEAFTMLQLTPLVICPPSTFCLWSGLANENTVYYLNGNLTRHRNKLHDKFNWITSPSIINLAKGFYHNETLSQLVKRLKQPLTKPLNYSIYG